MPFGPTAFISLERQLLVIHTHRSHHKSKRVRWLYTFAGATMNTNSSSPNNVSPAELYFTIYRAITEYHLSPTTVLTEPLIKEPAFACDDDVIDYFHHLFDQASDPYSRIVVAGESSLLDDIDPESDDTTPDITCSTVTPEIGLIRINKFRYSDCAEKFISAFKSLGSCKSFLLDLRNNPGGYYEQALRIAQSLVGEGNFGSRLVAKPDGFQIIECALKATSLETCTYDLGDSNRTLTSKIRLPDISEGKPIVVLVDEKTTSSAEILAALLKENGRAQLVGKRTFGKGRGTSSLDLPNGLQLQVIGSYWFTPSNQALGTGPDDPDKGIAPDHVIADGDHFINRAIALLES